MNKTIKISPEFARIIKSFGKSRTSLPSANGTKIVIRNPKFLRIIRAFVKASNQVKSSPLSLRSADNANYSEVQDLKDRIAKLINEKEYLKGQYDQQKEHDKAYYDNLQAQYNNLQTRHNDLNALYGNLRNRIIGLERYVNGLRGNVQEIKNFVRNLTLVVNNGNILQGDVLALNALARVQDFLNQI